MDGWSVKAIAGYLEASRPTVYDVLRLYATDHASPQPFLPPLESVAWHPVRRLASTGRAGTAPTMADKRPSSH